MNKKNFTSKSLHVEFPKDDSYRSLHMPIYESVAFDFNSSENIAANFRGEYPAHVYSRTSNPTVEFLEKKMKELTGARQALAVSSGMAAISSTIFNLCKSGDEIIAGKHLFGHSYALLNTTLAELGIKTHFSDLQNTREIEKLITPNTKIIYFETVTNPQLEVTDIEMLSKIAKQHNLVLVCDSTLTPPAIFNAKSLGIDIEVMSTTKYISGGATSVGGIVLDLGNYDWTSNSNFEKYAPKFGQDAFIAKLRKNIYRNMGQCMTAHAAYYQILGLDILELRLERSFNNCMSLCEFLNQHPKVKTVTYPAQKSSIYYELVQKQFNGIPGTIITIDLDSQESCFKFMNELKMIRRATNLNDNKSLIIHPYSTIYCEFSHEQRLDMHVFPTTMRLSVGIEGTEDLISDINQALEILN